MQQFWLFSPSNHMKGVSSVTGEERIELEELMQKYGSSLMRMCALILKDAALAQDAVQDTFIRAYRHRQDYRGDASEKTWLTSIARNVCRDYLRGAWLRNRHRRTSMDLLPECADAFEVPDDTVLTEVMRLPVKYREVVLLRYYEGLKLREIGQALSLTEGKVRSRLNKANAILRDRLKEWYDEA